MAFNAARVSKSMKAAAYRCAKPKADVCNYLLCVPAGQRRHPDCKTVRDRSAIPQPHLLAAAFGRGQGERIAIFLEQVPLGPAVVLDRQRARRNN